MSDEICLNCGKTIPEDSQFCNYCGHRVERVEEEEEEEILLSEEIKARRKRQEELITYGCFFLVFVVFVITILFIFPFFMR